MLWRDSSTRSPSRARRVGLIGLVGLVVGCGGGTAPVTSIGPVASSTSLAPPSTAPATTLAGESGQGVLQRRDVPPEAVVAQLEIVVPSLGGAPEEICAGPFPNGAQIVPVGYLEEGRLELHPQGAGVIEAGRRLELCLPGFDPAAPLEIEIRRPTVEPSVHDIAGATGEVEVRNIWWEPFPSDELGTYVLTASQGPIGAEVIVEVVLPRDQLMRVKPESAPPGAALLLGMAGFDPGAEVPLHLYGGSRYDMEYLASLLVEMDDQGRARTQLQTEPSDPPGFYCIFAFGTQSEEFGCDARFELTAPG